MPRRLRREEVVTIEVLAQLEMANTVVAAQLGVTEGAVRYRRNRIAQGVTDGRKKQAFKAAAHASTIAARVGRAPLSVTTGATSDDTLGEPLHPAANRLPRHAQARRGPDLRQVAGTDLSDHVRPRDLIRMRQPGL